MNLFALFSDKVAAAVRASAPEAGLDLGKITVEPPRDPAHGDVASNAALVLAKDLGAKPRDLAERIAAGLRADLDVAAVEVAGPGFINIRVAPAFWPRLLAAILAAGDDYGRGAPSGRAPINVEYVSANPTGPMHVGHGRGAVFGDALANLLAFAGETVTREYYINDAGAQVDVLARSAYLRYREALGEDVGAIPEGLYPGDYLVPVGRGLADTHGRALRQMPEAEWLPIVRAAAIDAMMAEIRADLAVLDIRHEVFFSERSLTAPVDKVAALIAELRARDLVYEGRLPPPKGQVPDDWEDREQTLFRATRFGDEIDRPLLKSDGGYTYFASDIAYHREKFARGFRRMIDVWGADHGGYVKRMQAAVAAVTGGEGELDVKLIQLVRLFRAGEPVRMSKRAGDFVTLRDVVDEVGRDAVRFMMLFRKNDAVLDFDFAKVVEQSRENPVFYVQYAHARTQSVLRRAEEAFPDGLPATDEAALAGLADPGEVDLIRRLGEWPRIVSAAAEAHEPHRVAFYLHDLASAFHGHWNRGNDAENLRFVIQGDPQLTVARIGLVRALAAVLRAGLGLLGVGAPAEMR
ncbi:MAG TPA: arginine--tRNA ligase [Hyphomicrobiales bacterium]|nr:arginine--tRNA ligase [Hyphomicrobiales bacterium]